ncbi:MAG TPA: hydantoinase [Planctomycetes bacterium]|nr:hydantoinase [Planctomycetota bacterium]
MNADSHPEFWIDVGGTFTDCIARFPDGTVRRHKTLSSGCIQGVVGAGSDSTRLLDPNLAGSVPALWRGYRFQLFDDGGFEIASAIVADFDPTQRALVFSEPLAVLPRPGLRYMLATGEHAPLVAIRFLLGLPADVDIGVVSVKLGTTRGTNALLTRTGARVGLLTTRGLADGLEIGHQNRPRLFELNIRKPERLYTQVCEVDERLAADGSVLIPLDEEGVRNNLLKLQRDGIETPAVCLLHSYVNCSHELRIRELARQIGFRHVSVSHLIAQTLGWIGRSDTTVVDAYLSPILTNYIDEIRSALGPESRLQLLTSAGDLVGADRFQGKDSVLSGPAGGVVGFSSAAQLAGFSRAIGFDMGGTSTDVSRFDHGFERQFETEKAGVRIVSPMLAIETVAAGGGSICSFDGVTLTVGPESAGADPGPACYGRGGPLTLTDVNLALGKLQASKLPFSLEHDAVDRRLDELCDRLLEAGHVYTRIELADGLLQIANHNIVQAIRSVSVARGADPQQYILAAFGGAAGQHACAVAAALGMDKILLHPDAGILSAWGIGAARAAQHTERAVYQNLTKCHSDLSVWLDGLAVTAIQALYKDLGSEPHVTIRRWVDARYSGTQACMEIAASSLDDLGDRFQALHQRRFGYRRELPVEVVRIRVEAIDATARVEATSREVDHRIAEQVDTVHVCFSGTSQPTSIYHRDSLLAGDVVNGPALVAETHATTVIDPGWRAKRLSNGELLVEKQSQDDSLREVLDAEAPDPVHLEILHNHFATIAEQMGIALRDTSVSVNVKERLDFSCALFTSEGDLIANAPHVPVHLGAMSETVKAIQVAFPTMQVGDAFISNDPYQGGSHLPDITVVSPMFLPPDTRPAFFTASRAHHAEIGGIVPGSMPPSSKTLEEEGVLLSSLQLSKQSVPDWTGLSERLTGARFPSRNVDDNLADIAAQLSANHRGINGLEEMVRLYSENVVRCYARHVLAASAKKMRRALSRVTPGIREFHDRMDNGAVICVRVEFRGETARLDFSGTSAVLNNNMNANRAITTAAVMYCLRLLLDEDVPLNQGVLEPVEVVLPECFLNPTAGTSPATSPAVASGNVETSQRIVDVILGAFGLAAASQGTMNNLTFGNERFGYYETIGGGEGATPHGDGASAVHTHMTNTRLTDPEVLEFRLPVRLWNFAIRRGSGGDGRFRGGDGLIREMEFLVPLQVALVAGRRPPYAPYGVDGGEAGESGESRLIRHDGEQCLPATTEFNVVPGDRLRISTPGGGGWGSARRESQQRLCLSHAKSEQ